MGIPLTDAALKKRVKKLDSVYRGSLWTEIRDFGACLALFGATDEAISLWNFAQSGKVLLPEQPPVFSFADAVQYALSQSSEVESIVKESDLQTRKNLTERLALNADWDEPPLSTTPKGMLQRGRALARPAEDGSPLSTELEALELLRAVLAVPVELSGATQVSRHDRNKAALLATDILARHAMRGDATATLRTWYDECAQIPENERFSDETEAAFGLISVTKLLTDGVLHDKLKLSAKKRAELIAQIIKTASAEPCRSFPQPEDEENSLVLRADFSDDAAWKSVCEAIRAGNESDPYATVEFVSDPDFDGLSVKEIAKRAKQGYGGLFLFVIDNKTLTHPKRPVLVIDLSEQPGRTFRAKPNQICNIEANLSTQNCGFEDYADNVDRDGITHDDSD